MDKIKILNSVDFEKLYAESKVQNLSSELDDYTSFELTHGYGYLNKAGVSVMRGVTANVHIDMSISTYAENSYQNTTNEMKNVLDSKVTEHLEESQSKSNHANWWFWLISSNDSDYEHHKNSTTETITTTDTTVSNSVQKNFSNNKQDYHLTGDFSVVGQSDTPTTAYLFIETLQIKTKNGNTTTVINSTPVAADSTGDTSKVSTDSDKKLNIIPL